MSLVAGREAEGAAEVLLPELEADRAAELDELGLGELGVQLLPESQAIACAQRRASRSRGAKRSGSAVSGSSARKRKQSSFSSGSTTPSRRTLSRMNSYDSSTAGTRARISSALPGRWAI